ncbi:MAG TPA: hypothetical protein ENG74_01145 [Thermoplasmatales archaeon]|nr:hypothetical protein [Thermoplasmatales archaeon]
MNYVKYRYRPITPFQRRARLDRVNQLIEEIEAIPVKVALNRKIEEKKRIEIIKRNIYGGVLKNIAESIQHGVVMLTTVPTGKGNIREPKEHIMNMTRCLEKKIDETMDAFEVLISNGCDDELIINQYLALRHLRRQILPELNGITSTYRGEKEKIITKLGDTVAELRKCLYQIETGEPYIPSGGGGKSE